MGVGMLRRSLLIAVALGLLFCGAAVSLEAVGLLFHPRIPDLQERVDAFVARIEADLSPVDLPTEPVEVPRELAQELAGQDAELASATRPAEEADGIGKAVEVSGRAEPAAPSDERMSIAVVSSMAGPLPETTAQSDDRATPSQSQEIASVVPAAQALSEAPSAAHPA